MKCRLILLLITLLFQSALPSVAALQTQTPRSSAITTGKWAAVASNQGATSIMGAYTILWTVSQGRARNFFTIKNVGNFSITGLTVTVTQSQSGGGGKAPNTTFDWCRDGTWNVTANTCSGSIVTVGVASDVTLAMTFAGLNLAVGSDINMRATTQPNLQNAYSSTVSVTVARSQIRNGVITNS